MRSHEWLVGWEDSGKKTLSFFLAYFHNLETILEHKENGENPLQISRKYEKCWKMVSLENHKTEMT